MKSSKRRLKPAFTLIELLVVIAIIAILAAMILPVLSSAKQKAILANCVSNYKQVSVGLHMYLDEHNDELPPGKNPNSPNYLDLTEKASYNIESTNFLPYYLAPFLSSPLPADIAGNSLAVAKPLACPGYVHAAPGGYQPESDNFAHAYSYTLTRTNNGQLPLLPGFPFGRRVNEQQALTLSEISQALPLSEVWALADLDMDSIEFPGSFGDDKEPYIAPEPVHKTARVYLFFDSHVGVKKSNGWEDF
ncbi:MAG TPA: prepilin-type N-terminal cleavage/methylation domain-containing protein [Verrucomicrobiae bacterium]|jgi:prepilin-type N-terminal cleavage/methylation domain-containing protein|nr:prepilin-type N-terminal cleavage/methylation domain-containing protein [Verrucomicrobiae bacterium]